MINWVRALIFMGAMLAANAGFAAATVESVTGDVKAGESVSQASAVRMNQRIDSGAVVVTGPASRVSLRFEDGQAIALHENAEFRIVNYVFSKDMPARDRSSLELLRGAMRYVSGAIGQRNPEAVVVRTRLATAGIRGTDFMLALVNPLFFQILNGQISVVNSAGAPVFAPGAIGTVSAEGTVALTVPASSLPAGVLQAFNQLSLLNLAALTPASPPATPAAALPAGVAGAVISGAILIGIAATLAGGEGNEPVTTTTGTTGTGTGTGSGTR